MSDLDKNKYQATIGLEIHAELKTKSKMFCSCKNDPDEDAPNVNVCPVCMGHPGTLPVLNKEAIKHVLRVGLSCGSEIANFTEWDRKNYFYPDIPKGYQISQYKYPLVVGGELNGVKLTRIHLEEDTASSTHDGGDFSLVNFNRSGVPLMELVTEPVIHSGKDASDFAKELQLLLQYLGAGDANLEKGEMRVEANISISDTEKLGTKVEVKNLNSFRSVERAIAYEIERHIEVLESGGKIVQETRGWDEGKQKTFSQRIKEDSHDYRYFPEPDLPKLMVREVFDLDLMKQELPELPWERRDKYTNTFGIKDTDAEIYVSNKDLSDFFEKLITLKESGKYTFSLSTGTSFITSDYIGLKKIDPTLKLPEPESFAKLVEMFEQSKISSRVAKDLLARLTKEDFNPEEISEKEGLIQKNNESELKIILEKLVADNPKIVEDYKAGKENAIMSLVGQAMKATKGSANPQIIKNILLTLLK